MTLSYDVVVPTVGRPSLQRTLDALEAGPGPRPERTLVVHDRDGRGPAAARNQGWRAGDADWVVFLDDDVVPGPGWRQALADDLACLGDTVAGSQGRLVVPLPGTRRPSDWERNVAGLESARWATADMAYRRKALVAVGGFDERFRRAYREDADLGARIVDAGWDIVQGRRTTVHPVRPADRWVSVRLQAGNADDVLLRVIHGRRWRQVTGVPAGRRGRHLAVTAAGAAGLAGLVLQRPALAAAGLGGWLAGTAELAWARMSPGPRTGEEITTMLLTSAAIPAAATWHWLNGWRTLPRRFAPPAAVLFDRDGTLVVDVPYNGDPDRVVPMPGAAEALARLRAARIPVAVVSNQSGVARRQLTHSQVDAVNQRIEALLGPVGPWLVCPHGPEDGCGCRKPLPGLLLQAAATLGVQPSRMAVVGDIGADVEAARAVGARGVLVPTDATRPEEIAAAPEVAPDLPAAVDRLLRPRPRP